MNRFLFALALTSILVSCNNDPLQVDLSSDQRLSMDYLNMDSLLFNNKESLDEVNALLKVKIPDLYAYQLGHCLGIGSQEDSIVETSLTLFYADTFVRNLEMEIAQKFNKLEKYKEEINEAFSYLHYHFPKGRLPKSIVFMNSFFASSAFCTENEIGVGLERYLGISSKSIQMLPPHEFFEWMKEDMNAEFLTRDVLASWILTHYIPETNGNLAEKMIYWGKVLYLTNATLPEDKGRIVLRYSNEDIIWAEENLYSFWKYLVDENMLFTKDEQLQANMLHEGPFTPGLPEKGPDRLGQFLGWKMVKQYVEFNDVSLKDLLDVPYNDILQSFEIE